MLCLHYVYQGTLAVLTQVGFEERSPLAVILSAAKNLRPRREILRCAQNDSSHLAPRKLHAQPAANGIDGFVHLPMIGREGDGEYRKSQIAAE